MWQGWLKPEVMVWLKGRRAEVVERRGRKPCWVSERRGMAAVRCGRMSLSSTLTGEAEEGDRAVGGARSGGLAGFREGDDGG